ncbi:hypothetical protein PVL29_016720 [Vitis rotundifolia]|uniref:Cucumisin n=1 Tax=Vitis rotundifolia TaxID=103349 RepID=A0AA38Z8X5_VITRO|nr:hypothetical protein PVL29_016720 [Vitis rotundifolia]
MDGVVSVFPNGKKKLLTTRSWDFMGFPQEVKRTATESDIIIGMLDSGIRPEPSNFSDEGFGPPPSKWKGTCQTSSNFTRNNKIIGAKYYRSDGKLGPTGIKSPRDSEGHGSHTASMASLLGLGSGTPDLTAPGVDIVSAWTKASTVTGYDWDTRVVPYNIVSGPSMDCPHASGAAAYVKSFHPAWSPAAIKSALMTTAAPMSVKSNRDQEFAYGAGQIDPIKAAHPGLINDAGKADYVKFLCGQGYSTKQLGLITGDKSTCSTATNATVWDLNCPSFAASTKTVTNVGSADSTYRAILGVPSGLNVLVEPSVLSFKSLGQKKTFSVSVSAGVENLCHRMRDLESMDPFNSTIRIRTLVPSPRASPLVYRNLWVRLTYHRFSITEGPTVIERLSLICTLVCTHSTAAASKDDGRKAIYTHLSFEYIVYMGAKPAGDFSASAIHTDMLQQVFGSSRASNSLVRSYKRSFNGFVAKLTEEEMQQMKGMDGVVSIFPNEKKQLHTTRSWDFVGFPQKVKRTSVESDIIIGVLDTGIWPESDSFDDEGFGPPPSKWIGTCQGFSNFTCNNKIIGAKYYRSIGQFGQEDLQSPRDSDGHGTHTASTAAGGLVNMASLMGFGLGTARGGVPSARIAVYKICWSDGCFGADVLAAFDDAIADGVDIISVSLGGTARLNYFEDPIAIGAFHGMKKGILTSTSAGNDGPDLVSIKNFSPWSLCVAASTIDRNFFTKVQLGDSKVFKGVSINTFELNDMYPLIYGGDAPNTAAGFSGNISRFCFRSTLNPNLVKGKIVLCDIESSGTGAFLAGAVGTLMADRLPKDSSRSFPLPASHLSARDGSSIANYINSTSKPTASIFKSTEVSDTLAPYVVSFSSRGPNPASFDLLKPDIAAPGVRILAAWPPISPVSGVKGDNRAVRYNIISGTSMSCPHATGAAAYIKSFHPTWSPAAIKSALMTTATLMSARKNREGEFAYGAGNIDPLRAVHPGLVYDADEIDFVNFLCGEGYSVQHLRNVTGDHSVCSKATNGTVWDLNYPSFALSTSNKESIARTFQRSVTNVGSPMSTYKAIVIGAPKGLKINVKPKILSFISIGQKLSFVLKVKGRTVEDIVSASLVWDDGLHKVRSPIVVYAVE